MKCIVYMLRRCVCAIVMPQSTQRLVTQSIRKTAIPLMQYLVGRFFKDARAAPYQLSVTSVLPTTYQQSQVCPSCPSLRLTLPFAIVCYCLMQLLLSRTMAESHPSLAEDMFVEMCKRFESLDHYGACANGWRPHPRNIYEGRVL